jgi:hypothetical protein
MFLPVLLIRDYGVWGFVVFAVPNVIGAGAMGWVLRRGSAERLAERHQIACACFSIVTIAFQMYFAGWFLFRLDRTSGYSAQDPLVMGLLGATVLFAALAWGVLGRRARWGRWALSIGALAISVACGVLLLHAGVLDRWNDAQLRSGWSHHPNGLLWLAPVCVFGFALCPYLDLTFLRAGAAGDSRASRASFTLGFGVLFAAMILLTLAYAPAALGLMGYPIYKVAPFAIVVPLAAHLFVQLGTTVAFHIDELRRLPPAIGRAGIAILLMLLIAVAIVCTNIDWHVIARLEMLDGEVIYRCFMSFYGLVFPAYVWLCMISTRDGHSGIAGPRGRVKLAVLAGACLLAAPCYWMGFIERVEWWLAPGLGVVLLARLLVRGHSSPSPASPQ